MPLVLDHPHLTDTLRYRVLARKVLPQGDVKLAVQVIALVQAGDRDQAALEKRIREALEAMVAAKWVFASIVREADATGYERVRLVAMARVGAAENWNLAARARAASREGLQIGTPKVDYSLSRERVDAAYEELRLEILKRAEAHAADLSKTGARQWRVGDIAYGGSHDAYGVRDPDPFGSRASPKGAYRDEEEVMFSALEVDDGDGEAMAGAERISLVAAVTLKAAVRST